MIDCVPCRASTKSMRRPLSDVNRSGGDRGDEPRGWRTRLRVEPPEVAVIGPVGARHGCRRDVPGLQGLLVTHFAATGGVLTYRSDDPVRSPMSQLQIEAWTGDPEPLLDSKRAVEGPFGKGAFGSRRFDVYER